MIAGLNLAYNDRGIGTASVNISIGGGLFSGNCDSTYASFKTAIDNLRSVNIATVIAAGNDGSATQISHPGCISTAETIGATDNSDAVAYFSNSSAVVDFYAPGYPCCRRFLVTATGTRAAPRWPRRRWWDRSP